MATYRPACKEGLTPHVVKHKVLLFSGLRFQIDSPFVDDLLFLVFLYTKE